MNRFAEFRYIKVTKRTMKNCIFHCYGDTNDMYHGGTVDKQLKLLAILILESQLSVVLYTFGILHFNRKTTTTKACNSIIHHFLPSAKLSSKTLLAYQSISISIPRSAKAKHQFPSENLPTLYGIRCAFGVCFRYRRENLRSSKQFDTFFHPQERNTCERRQNSF
jgi:hypothetical protein